MRMLLLIALLLAGCATTRRAAPGETQTAAAPGETNEKGEKLVCRRERVTGSNMRKRICRYESDKQKEREAAQEALRRQHHVAGEGPN